jgi:hypothetical protein
MYIYIKFKIHHSTPLNASKNVSVLQLAKWNKLNIKHSHPSSDHIYTSGLGCTTTFYRVSKTEKEILFDE